MSISLDDFRSRVRETPQAQARIMELKGMAQDVPRMVALTGDTNWDYYLRHIEAQIKAAERMVAIEKEKLSSPAITLHEQMLLIKNRITIWQSRAETLREVIALPKYLRDQGERAAKLVAELEASV